MHFFQKFFAVAEGATVAFARKVIPIWLDLLSSEEPKFQIIHRPEKPRPVICPHYNLNSIAVATEGLTPLINFPSHFDAAQHFIIDDTSI